MADASQEERRGRIEVPTTGNTPVHPAHFAASTHRASAAPDIGKPVEAQASIVNSGNKSDTVKQMASPLPDESILKTTKGTVDANDSLLGPSRSLHLQDIDSFIAHSGLADTLDLLPEPSTYIFAVSDNKAYFEDRKLLFLGETANFQSWARLKSSPLKPDDIEYVHFSFLSNRSTAAAYLDRLPVNMYPFSILAEKGNSEGKEQLTVLVRYIFREAAGFQGPFDMESKQTLRSALVVIQDAVKKARGVEKLLDIHPPAKLPEGLSYVNSPTVISDTMTIDDSSDAEVMVYKPSAPPSARSIFSVPAITKPRKQTRPAKTHPNRITKPTTTKNAHAGTRKGRSTTPSKALYDAYYNELEYKPPPTRTAPTERHKTRPTTPSSTDNDPVLFYDEPEPEPFPPLRVKRKPEPVQKRVLKPESRPNPNPTPKQTPTPAPAPATHTTTPAKRPAPSPISSPPSPYTALSSLEHERAAIEAEKAEIARRQLERRQGEAEDLERLRRLEERGGVVDGEEGRLLEGRSAGWLLAVQRKRRG
ncbi:hypothetical protein C7974DRAFT_470349 [Boeremia exigua]|uniref:uncharacterized protein n=1 Tax=Boeremia exigua TaxID=749465 RepID=UPI001E8E6170|nr:uncharacterized protein C7974DRAFT_470349 [Boeremia exigua]KAH6637417.1 hypothetical protein C7974DRAFT_470349 [Boeremia exigua]